MTHRVRENLRRLRSQQGAVTIEALGLIAVMIAAFLVFIVIGAAYWNLTLMNSTSQSVSLAQQSIMDRYCSANISARCGYGQSRAQAATDAILTDAQQSMIMLGDAPACSGVSYGKICNEGRIQPAPATVSGSGNLPDRRGSFTQPGMPAGWNWSYANLKTTFAPLGGPQLPVRSASLTLSYKDPSR